MARLTCTILLSTCMFSLIWHQDLELLVPKGVSPVGITLNVNVAHDGCVAVDWSYQLFKTVHPSGHQPTQAVGVLKCKSKCGVLYLNVVLNSDSDKVSKCRTISRTIWKLLVTSCSTVTSCIIYEQASYFQNPSCIICLFHFPQNSCTLRGEHTEKYLSAACSIYVQLFVNCGFENVPNATTWYPLFTLKVSN